MNVLFITHNDGFYGSSRSLMCLIQGLEGTNIKPFVLLSRTNRFSDALKIQGVMSKTTPIPWWMCKNKLSLYEMLYVLKEIFLSVGLLVKACREWRIDLIYTNSSVTPVGRLAALIVGIPHVWHIREFGDLHHGLKFIYPSLLSKTLINSSNAVIFNSRAVRDYYSPKRNRKNYHVIPNGVTHRDCFSRLMEQRQLIIPDEVFTFLIVGAVTQKKGQEQSIRAISELQKCGYMCRLLIAGSGEKDYLDQLEMLCVELGIQDKVTFLGFVEDPTDTYLQAECLLVCSEFEAFGRVTAEGMSVGLPVIAKNSGGTPEVVENGKTGILYDDFDGLVSAMKTIIDNPDWSKSLGLAGWNRAKENFSVEEYSIKVYSVIQSVM